MRRTFSFAAEVFEEGIDNRILRRSDTNGAQDSLVTINDEGTIILVDGSLTFPSLSFSSDETTGIYRTGNNTMGFVSNGTLKLSISDTVIESTVPYLGPNGLSSSPSFSFFTDTDTGIYKTTSEDTLCLVTGGVNAIAIGPEQKIKVGTNSPETTTGLGVFEIETTSSTALPALLIDQKDIDEAFISFEGTSSSGTSRSISTNSVGSASVTGPDSGTWTNSGMIKIKVNDSDFWIPYYSEI